MASIPQGAFAARKVRANMGASWERSLFESRQDEKVTGGQKFSQEKAGGQWSKPSAGKEWASNHFPKLNQQILFTVLDHPPAKYNSKLMNSIWGLYNRYSVHNFKKIAGDVFAFGQQQPAELMMIKSSSAGIPTVAASTLPCPRGGVTAGIAATPAPPPAVCYHYNVGGARKQPTPGGRAWETFLTGAYQH